MPLHWLLLASCRDIRWLPHMLQLACHQAPAITLHAAIALLLLASAMLLLPWSCCYSCYAIRLEGAIMRDSSIVHPENIAIGHYYCLLVIYALVGCR